MPALSSSHDRPLRIGYFLAHFPLPTALFFQDELRELVNAGHDVKVFCCGSYHEDPSILDFWIDYELVNSPEQLAARLVETQRDIAHAHFIYPTVTDFLWPACERAGIPFTFIPHGQDLFRYTNDKKHRIGEIARSRQCARVLVPSTFHRDYVLQRGVQIEKLTVHPNSIDPSRYAGGQVDDRFRRRRQALCAIHRFIPKKGLDVLIRAAKLMEPNGLTFNIFGFGDLESEYRTLISDLQLKNVALHDAVESRIQMLAIFREHDLFACNATRAKDGDMNGLPTVLIEAMSAGLPVFAPPTAGIPDPVQDGITGLLCDRTPEGVAATIARYYAMPDDAVNGIVDCARQHIQQNFHVATLTRELARLWREAVKGSI